MNLKSLTLFLYLASQKGYGTGKYSKWIKEKDGSTSIIFKDKDWEMNDNFFGGDPFGGRTIVFYKNKPVWIMTYYGQIPKDAPLETEEVYQFLQKALLKTSLEFPLRGPKKYTQSEFIYQNSWEGKINRFQGKESILVQNKKIYQGNYLGGLVNLRAG